MRRPSSSAGFTLIELLVVIVIIGLLMGMLMPALAAVKESNRRVHCQNNLHQYGIAINAYHQAQGSYPIGNYTQKWWTFQARLLPFLEHDEVYRMIDFKCKGDCFQFSEALPADRDPGNRIYQYDVCPNDENAGKIWYAYPGYGRHGCTNYLGCMGTNSQKADGVLLYGKSVTSAHITDGLGKTILMGERGIPDDLYWGWTYCGYGDGTGNGDNLLTTQYGLSVGSSDGNHTLHYWAYHRSLAMFLFADGGARPLDYDIDFKTFQALSTRAGNEPLDGKY